MLSTLLPANPHIYIYMYISKIKNLSEYVYSFEYEDEEQYPFLDARVKFCGITHTHTHTHTLLPYDVSFCTKIARIKLPAVSWRAFTVIISLILYDVQ